MRLLEREAQLGEFQAALERAGRAWVLPGVLPALDSVRHERAVELSHPSVRRIEHHRQGLEVAGAEPSRLVHHTVAAADDQGGGPVRRRRGRRPRPAPGECET
jgi:hypothetical protein